MYAQTEADIAKADFIKNFFIFVHSYYNIYITINH